MLNTQNSSRYPQIKKLFNWCQTEGWELRGINASHSPTMFKKQLMFLIRIRTIFLIHTSIMFHCSLPSVPHHFNWINECSNSGKYEYMKRTQSQFIIIRQIKTNMQIRLKHEKATNEKKLERRTYAIVSFTCTVHWI